MSANFLILGRTLVVTSWITYVNHSMFIMPVVMSWITYVNHSMFIMPVVMSWITYVNHSMFIMPVVMSWITYVNHSNVHNACSFELNYLCEYIRHWLLNQSSKCSLFSRSHKLNDANLLISITIFPIYHATCSLQTNTLYCKLKMALKATL